MKTTQLSFDGRWIKIWHICTVEYWSAIKRWNIAIYSNVQVDLKSIVFSEMSDGRGRELYEFARIQDMKQKAANKQNQKTNS